MQIPKEETSYIYIYIFYGEIIVNTEVLFVFQVVSIF